MFEGLLTTLAELERILSTRTVVGEPVVIRTAAGTWRVDLEALEPHDCS